MFLGFHPIFHFWWNFILRETAGWSFTPAGSFYGILTNNMTPKLEKKLIEAAEEGVRNALTVNQSDNDPRYGAAVVTQAGNIYASGQYHSDTASLTLHAEQAALAHASAHGEHIILAIAIAWNETGGSGDSSVYPCHMCKQLLWESYLRSGEEIEVLISEQGVVIERLYLTKIMSHTWPK